MKSTLLVPFGLRDEELFEPTEVENGKACGCVCPACNTPLIAKQNAATPHFAHAPGEDCARGFETAVHLAVKQLIAKRSEVRLPAVVWTNPVPISRHQVKKLYIERRIKPESVVLEKVFDDIRPDIVVVSNGTTYLVEVAVTHFVDLYKRAKIKDKKLYSIEIDVSDLKNSFTFKELEKAIYSDTDYKANWIYHPSLEQLDKEALEQEARRVASIEAEQQQCYAKYRKYRDKSPEEKLQLNLKYIGLTMEEMESLTKSVPNNFSNGIPEIVWQSAVLAYLAKVQEFDGLQYPVRWIDCFDWLEKVFEINPYVADGEKIALLRYFKHLVRVRILKQIGSSEFQVLVGKQDWAGSS